MIDRHDSNAPARSAHLAGLQPSPTALRTRIDETRVQHLFDHVPLAATVNIVLGTLVAGIVHGDAPSAQVWTWWALLMVITGVRVLQFVNYRAAPDPQNGAWARRYLVALSVSGLAWGASIPLFVPSVPPLHESIVTITVAGVVAGALPINAGILRVYLTYVATVLGPAAVTYFSLGRTEYLLLGAMTLLYAGGLVLGARNYRYALHRAYDLSARLEHANEQLAHQASHDILTGLYNRARFEAAFDRELERVQRYQAHFALIMLDIDHFKQINDDHGHAEGDRVLRDLGRIFSEQVRSPDVASRWGGEEFMILLPETDLAAAEQVAERLRRRIEHADVGDRVHVTASLGVTECRYPEERVQIFKRLDEALYTAKESGRNCVRSTPLPQVYASA